MAITIVATAGSASANSYITEAELATWIEQRLHNSSTLTAATDATKKAALVNATRLLDELIEWDGDPADADVQALQWPRSDLEDDKGEDLSATVIPQRLKNATAELAIYLIDSDRTAELSSEGVKALAVGSVKVEFRDTSPPARKVIPDAVFQMISLWGLRKYSKKGYVTVERA